MSPHRSFARLREPQLQTVSSLARLSGDRSQGGVTRAWCWGAETGGSEPSHGGSVCRDQGPKYEGMPPGEVGGIWQNSQSVVPLSFTFTLASDVAFSFYFGESKFQMKCFAQ